jgi:hypothetical protein
MNKNTGVKKRGAIPPFSDVDEPVAGAQEEKGQARRHQDKRQRPKRQQLVFV